MQIFCSRTRAKPSRYYTCIKHPTQLPNLRPTHRHTRQHKPTNRPCHPYYPKHQNTPRQRVLVIASFINWWCSSPAHHTSQARCTTKKPKTAAEGSCSGALPVLDITTFRTSLPTSLWVFYRFCCPLIPKFLIRSSVWVILNKLAASSALPIYSNRSLLSTLRRLANSPERILYMPKYPAS